MFASLSIDLFREKPTENSNNNVLNKHPITKKFHITILIYLPS